MGELTFFLGLKVTQKDNGIFISQDRYVDEILKKFGFSTVKTTSTPMETSKPLIKDENAEGVDVHLYRSMIGSLMYLTFSRPDIMFAVCACAKFQVTPKVSHLHAMKRIYGYLKGQPNLGLWYPKDSPFNLEAYTDSDYAGASLDRKSTIGGLYINDDWKEVKHLLRMELRLALTQKHSKTKRNATEISQSSGPTTLVADETVHEERRDIVERATTTAASLDAELDSGTINRTQSTAIPNESIPQGTGLGGSLRCQDTILRDRPAQTRFERLSKQSHKPPLSRVNTLGSGEDSMQLIELMEVCTKLSAKVLSLENNKTAQDLEITHLKKRVKRLEKKRKSRTPQLKRRLFKVRIESYAEKSLGDQEDASNPGRNDQDEGISFFQDAEIQGRYGHDIEINTSSTSITTTIINITIHEPVTTVSTPITTAGVSISTVEPSTHPTITTTVIEDKDLIIAQTLMKMRSEKSKEKAKERGSKEKSSKTATIPTRGVILREASETTTRPTLKNKSFEEVQKALDNTMSWINSFVPMDKEEVEGIGKKAERSGKCCYAMLDDFDRQDVLDLPEGYDRLLWGDLMTLFEPKKEYPLTQEMLSKMLSERPEVDHECKMAYELIRIRRLLSADEVIAASYEITTTDYGFYCWLLSAIEVTATDMKDTTAGSSYYC
nr:uncharacterized mitochondrial protein AtMg00810-like [Tanacetum cinerariifolium]